VEGGQWDYYRSSRQIIPYLRCPPRLRVETGVLLADLGDEFFELALYRFALVGRELRCDEIGAAP